MQTELLTKLKTSAGEEITLEVASKKITAYSQAYPTDPAWFFIGREIIEKVLAQPNCVGIKFYNALYADGTKTLVYVGIDGNGKAIIEMPVVNSHGQLAKNKGIVANRPVQDPMGRSGVEGDWWIID